MATATGSTTRVGAAWNGANGIYESISTEAHWDEFPESAPLGDRQRNLYVTARLHQRLLDMRYMRGGIEAGAYAQETWQLDQIALGYLNPGESADG